MRFVFRWRKAHPEDCNCSKDARSTSAFHRFQNSTSPQAVGALLSEATGPAKTIDPSCHGIPGAATPLHRIPTDPSPTPGKLTPQQMNHSVKPPNLGTPATRSARKDTRMRWEPTPTAVALMLEPAGVASKSLRSCAIAN